MPLSTRISAYEDCFDLYTRAASTEKGTRVLLGTWEAAKHYQMRMHQLRVLIRDEARRMYDSNDIRYDKCEFDNLSVKIREDTTGMFWVYVQRYDSKVFRIEDIDDEVEANPELEPDADDKPQPPETIQDINE